MSKTLLRRGQVVRQQVLVLPFGGSNPSASARDNAFLHSGVFIFSAGFFMVSVNSDSQCTKAK